MKTIVLTLFAAVIVVCLSSLTTVTTGTIPPTTPPAAARKMQAFKSEQDLKRYFKRLAAKQKRMAVGMASGDAAGVAPAPVTKAAEPPPLARARSSEESESITNTQHVGVDEGDIIKLHGDHLVILRRGRLFTVAINESLLKPVSAIDAFGPDIDPNQTWYDEMLVSSDTIAIIGYSYQREGTEVGLFNIDAQGKLSYRATYHLRSNDYYSSRNYASRLIGEKLIFYAPLYLYPGEDEYVDSLPAVRKWHKGASEKEFQRIVPAQRIYRPEYSFNTEDGLALHTVTVCDLSDGGFNCQATSAIGPEGNVFYVSPDSVYVWATSWTYGDEDKSKSILFRMPLDGSGPSALRVSGSPVDQFSFLQSDDFHLNVLVRSEGKGDGMWAAEMAEGDVALLRVPLNSFSDGSLWAPRSSYRRLPKPEGDTFQNRFIGNYLLYGTGSGWFDSEKNKAVSELYVVEWAKRGSNRLQLPHGVDRIEQMSDDAVVVGTDGKDLHFSAIRLGGRPEIVSRYTRRGATQGELRSHGFFYKPDSENSGLLGLPIGLPGRPGYEHLFESSAAILFLRNEGLQFQEIGELAAQADKAVDDRCRASCVDWYGNARPVFLRGRMFALLGYELVEGSVMQGRIREVGRINYAPQL